ncbi:MAG: hypothetical protein JNK05_37065 [Myxococcales bacterium]|nr:hypothetical protein [Myxococcales bacterium]
MPRLGLVAADDDQGPTVITWAVDDDSGLPPWVVDPRGAVCARRGESELFPTALHDGQAVSVSGIRGAIGDRAVVAEVLGGGRARLDTPFGDTETPQHEAKPIVWPGVVPFADGPATSFAKLAEASARFNKFTAARRFAARWATLEARAAFEADGMHGATWIDCALLEHQLAVVRRALEAPTVRWVLADEVGLGKSLEALMIWSALSSASPGLRCAISAPKELLFQWSLEVRRRTERRVLARRADDLAPIFDPRAPERCFDEANPRGITLLEHDALPALLTHSVEVDLLVVDEAHKLNQLQREAVEQIVGQTKSVLLLTATPRETRRARGAVAQFGGFSWAVSLVDPKWPPADRAEAETAHERAERVGAALVRAREVDGSIRSLDPEAARRERETLRRETPLERVLRSRRAALPSGLVARRELIRVPIEYSEAELALLRAARALELDDLDKVVARASSSWDALASASGARELRSQLAAVRPRGDERALDAKREALLDLCATIWHDDPNAKIVIRCEFAETRRRVVEALRDALLRGGLRTTAPDELAYWREPDAIGPVAVLDRDQDAMLEGLRSGDVSKDSMLANLWSFERAERGGSPALVANDAASAGLNLQFASALILHDVPWSPTLAQQWVGRLDRLGQRAGVVRVYSLTHPMLPSDQLLDVYERLNIFNSRPAEFSADVERAVLQLSSSRSEQSWEERVRAALDEVARQPIDDDGGAALDLDAEATSDEREVRLRASSLADALNDCGLSVQEHDDDLLLRWPIGDEDQLHLPRLSAGLRRRRSLTHNPEVAAMQSEEVRSLRLTTRRLGERRWIRSRSSDFFSPRHPLFVDLEQDLLRDPSLALARLTVRSVEGVKPGAYLLALCRSFPGHGGEAIGWTASRRALATASLSETLATEWAGMIRGLSRMTRMRVPVRVRRVACDVKSAAPLSDDARERLIDALRVAESSSSSVSATEVRQRLESLEEAAPSPDDVEAVQSAIDDFAREAGFEVERTVAKRRRDRDAWLDSGDMGRRQRDARQRDLDDAELLGRLVDVARGLVEVGAREAARLRVLCAAVVEVRE